MAVGVANANVVLLPAFVAVSTVAELPCNVNAWPVAPTVIAPLGVIIFVFKPANVGVAPVLMSWIVLTLPVLTVRFVALKLAIPLVESVASSMVIVEPAALAFAILSAPPKPFSDDTPPAVGQAAQVGAPLVDNKQSPVLAAVTEVMAAVPWPTKMPLAANELAPVPPLLTVSGLLRFSPPVITLKSPVIVTVMPLWVIIEFSIFCEPVYMGTVPAVPPELVIVPDPAAGVATLILMLPLPSLATVTFGVPADTLITPLLLKLVPFSTIPAPAVKVTSPVLP